MCLLWDILWDVWVKRRRLSFQIIMQGDDDIRHTKTFDSDEPDAILDFIDENSDEIIDIKVERIE
jgi:hypothetical protein